MGAASTDNILRKIDESIASELDMESIAPEQVQVETVELTEEEKQAKIRWEHGQPDYMGISSTENIMQKLDIVVGSNSRASSKASSRASSRGSSRGRGETPDK